MKAAPLTHIKSRGSVRSIAILSLLIIVIISGVSALLLSQFLRQNLLQRDAIVTQELVQSIAYTQDVGGYFVTRNSSQSKAVLETFFNQIVQLPDVVRANVFAVDGMVLWSNQTQLIGKRFPDNGELNRALSGELIIETGELETTNKAEHILFEWQIEQWFVESYIPIRDRGLVVGVVELYKVPRTLSETIAKSTLIVWISVLVGGLIFFVVLYWFMPTRTVANDRQTISQQLPPDSATVDSYTQETTWPRWELDESVVSDPMTAAPKRRAWLPALATVLIALLAPVAIGIGVLYLYGVADDAPLSKSIDSNQSPLAFVASLVAGYITDEPVAVEHTISQQQVVAPAPDVVKNTADNLASEIAEADSSKVAVASLEPKSPANFTNAVLEQEVIVSKTDNEQESPIYNDSAAELLFWESVKDSNDAQLYQAYLAQYPRGTFASIAAYKVQQLTEQLGAEITTLLQKAWRAFDNQSLTTPLEDNAVKWAEAVLTLDSKNGQAQEVLNAVIDTYLGWAMQTYNRGKLALANSYLSRAQALSVYALAEQQVTIDEIQKLLDKVSPRTEQRTRAARPKPTPQAIPNFNAQQQQLVEKNQDVTIDTLAQRVRERLASYGRDTSPTGSELRGYNAR